MRRNATTDKNPNRDAAKAWKSLKSKFKPDSLTVATNHKKEFMELKMDSINMDPEEYIDKLESKRILIKGLVKGK